MSDVTVWMAALWRASWQGGLALLAVWGVCRVFSRLHPAVKAWLWRLAYLKLLLTLVWLQPIPLPMLPAKTHGTAAQVSATTTATTATPLPRVTSASLTSSYSGVAARQRPYSQPWRLIDFLPLLAFCWLIGAGYGYLRLRRFALRTRRLRRACRPVEDAQCMTMLANLSARLRLRRPPALLTSEVAGPLLLGILHPAVVIPAALLTTPKELRLVLAHELAHIKRRDILWGWLPVLAQVFCYFHPVVWLVHRDWRLAQEMACDALALEVTGGEACAYGEMLVKLAIHPVPAELAVAGIAEPLQTLKARIIALGQVHMMTRRQIILTGLLLGIVGLAGLGSWQLVAAEPDALASGHYAFTRQWGAEGTGTGQFSLPLGIAVDRNGNVYVADSDADKSARIEKFTSDGKYLMSVGKMGEGPGELQIPHDMAVDRQGNIYVSDSITGVTKFTADGKYLTRWAVESRHPAGAMVFDSAWGIAIAPTGQLYVVDNGGDCVIEYSATGQLIRQWGTTGNGNGQFNSPRGIAVDAAGNVCVADCENNRIQKFTAKGQYLTQWGLPGQSTRLVGPEGVAVDSAGNVYVTSEGDVQQFSADGKFLAGWSTRNLLREGLFDYVPHPLLRDVAVDTGGNVYVIDSGRECVQKFTPTSVQSHKR